MLFHSAQGRCLGCARPWWHCFVLLWRAQEPEEATLCPTLCSHVCQLYLQVIVEELPHTPEAATGQLVLLQPEQSVVHMILTDVNVRTGLSKGPGYKSCQPVNRAWRNPMSKPGDEPERTIGLGGQYQFWSFTMCCPGCLISQRRCRSHHHVCRAADAGNLWRQVPGHNSQCVRAWSISSHNLAVGKGFTAWDFIRATVRDIEANLTNTIPCASHSISTTRSSCMVLLMCTMWLLCITRAAMCKYCGCLSCWFCRTVT